MTRRAHRRMCQHDSDLVSAAADSSRSAWVHDDQYSLGGRAGDPSWQSLPSVARHQVRGHVEQQRTVLAQTYEPLPAGKTDWWSSFSSPGRGERPVGSHPGSCDQEDDLSTEEGGSDESRGDVTDKARERDSRQPAFRRMLTGSSAAMAAMRRMASSSSHRALVEAHVPPAWRRPRRLLLGGALLLAAIAFIVVTRSTIPRHPAPETTAFPIDHRVVLRFIHSTGRVHVKAGPDGQVSITEHRNGMTSAIHTGYRQQGDVITVNVSVGGGLPVATWVDFVVAIPRETTANVEVAAGTLEAAGLTGNLALGDQRQRGHRAANCEWVDQHESGQRPGQRHHGQRDHHDDLDTATWALAYAGAERHD